MKESSGDVPWNHGPSRVRGRHYRTGIPIVCDVSSDGLITSVEEQTDADSSTWPWIAPALFDLQINGAGGTWFGDGTLTRERIVELVRTIRGWGVARFCPTLITNSFEAVRDELTRIRAACETSPAIDAAVAGIHLEGPWISPVDGPRGAHPLAHVRRPDWNEFVEWQNASGGRVKLITLAPEVPGAIEMIRQLTAHGVAVALGHTAADAHDIAAAVAAGATLSTHLGNGCASQLHRHRNPFWPQLAAPELSASLIADGWHVPNEFLRTVLLAKSSERVVLTCDASGWAGLPPGRYENALGAAEILPSGKLVVAGQTELLAGANTGTWDCVREFVARTGCPLADAVEMASIQPARLLRVSERRIEPGAPADLLRIDPATLEIVASWFAHPLD